VLYLHQKEIPTTLKTNAMTFQEKIELLKSKQPTQSNSKLPIKKQSKKDSKKWEQRELVANTTPMSHDDYVEYTKGATKRDLDFVRNVKL
jgi:hypothetical protein